MTEKELIEALTNFRDFQSKDVEQQKLLFDFLDSHNSGELTQDDFLQGVKSIPGYRDNKDLVEECLKESFGLLGKCFGSKRLTPEILFLMYQNYNE